MSQVAAVRAIHPDERAGGAPDSPLSVTFSRDLVSVLDPLSESAETLRAVRTHLLAQHIHAGRRALAVCATSVGAGCTFLATNLAVSMAQAGLQVLLIDADLRQPSVDSIITPAQPTVGLAECLANLESSPSDYIQTDVLPGLSILYAGRPAPNAQELLARDRFEQVLNACQRDYELTIIDTPPANAFADVRRIATIAGYALIVARRNKSLVPDVKTLAEQLQSDNAVVVGTVMNA
jgi:protein-tyrosine kinase